MEGARIDGAGKITISSSNGVVFSDSSSIGTANSLGMRNRIINGAMRVDQRNAGLTQTITAGAVLAYTVDRFYAYSTGANVTGQRVAGTGSTQYRYQFTGAASVTKIGFAQRIEQVNCYDLASSTATLSVDLSNSLLTTVTWVASYANTADTFGTLASPTITQIATGTFTVTSTITRYATNITIPALATTGIQIELSVAAQTSGTFIIGNVQLEKGSVSTPFEQRPFGMELGLCQRYYEKSFPLSVKPANGPNSTSFVTDEGLFIGITSNGTAGASLRIIEKRITPTVIFYGNNSGFGKGMTVGRSETWAAASIGGGASGTNSMTFTQQIINDTYISIFVHWTASAEL